MDIRLANLLLGTYPNRDGEHQVQPFAVVVQSSIPRVQIAHARNDNGCIQCLVREQDRNLCICICCKRFLNRGGRQDLPRIDRGTVQITGIFQIHPNARRRNGDERKGWFGRRGTGGRFRSRCLGGSQRGRTGRRRTGRRTARWSRRGIDGRVQENDVRGKIREFSGIRNSSRRFLGWRGWHRSRIGRWIGCRQWRWVRSRIGCGKWCWIRRRFRCGIQSGRYGGSGRGGRHRRNGSDWCHWGNRCQKVFVVIAR
mmetsp:Transcript_32243/g.47651  ORF Transcript_32243/g.47651 Transcript_32243/m.47651 type:complete len:255 (+) Transcript_32243:1241-2005(+)